MEIDRIYCEDCLEGMKRIPSGSVDCVICDLPYGVLNKGNKHARWDRPIPLTPLWEQYRRVIKPSSPVILFAQGMFTAELMMSQRGMWRYNLVWMKNTTTGFLNANRMPLRKHEDILVFYQHLPVYHPQMKPCAPGERNHINKCGGTNRLYGKFTPPCYAHHRLQISHEHHRGGAGAQEWRMLSSHTEARSPGGISHQDVHQRRRPGAGQLHGFWHYRSSSP